MDHLQWSWFDLTKWTQNLMFFFLGRMFIFSVNVVPSIRIEILSFFMRWKVQLTTRFDIFYLLEFIFKLHAFHVYHAAWTPLQKHFELNRFVCRNLHIKTCILHNFIINSLFDVTLIIASKVLFIWHSRCMLSTFTHLKGFQRAGRTYLKLQVSLIQSAYEP